MPDHRGADSAPAPSPMMPQQPAEPSAPSRRFLIFSLTVLVFSLIAAGLVAWWQPMEPRAEWIWIGLLLCLGFLAAEQLAVNIDVRGGVSWTISFTEIPLVIGLFVAPFQVVLVANVIAGVGTLLARRVQDRIIYNTGVFTVEIACAFAVAAVLKSTGPVWFGVLAGAMAAPVITTLLALAALHMLGRRMRVGAAVRLIARTLVLGVVNASVGVVGYQVTKHVEAGWPLVLIALSGLTALYVAYSGLVREQRDLEALSEVSLVIARTGHQAAARPATGLEDTAEIVDGEDWQGIAYRIKDQLGAARVVVRLQFHIQGPMRTFVAGEPLPDDLYAIEVTGPRADPLLRLPGSHVRHFRRSDSVPEIRQSMLRRGVDEALVVPLRSATHLLGVVEVHDKLSRWRGFGQADLRLIGTTASHLATAIDNRRLLAALRHDAYHDPLTGLLNRAGFRQAASEQLRITPASVVMRVDLDVLAAISDALGYAWSDRMVITAGRRLRDVVGPEVPLARLESGAFAALLVGMNLDDAHALAERICAELSASYPVDRLTVEAASVVGYSSPAASGSEMDSGPSAALDVDTLLQRADVALRAARSSGEKVRAYLPSMGQIFLRRFQLVSQFRQALETAQVKVHYQPKVALPSRQLLGVEVLVRWRHPEFGALDPDEFVPAIEAAGLVDALTDFVLDQALVRVRKWLDRGLRISAAVNISVRSLADANFPDRVAERLERHRVPAELLTLELTESGVMADPQRALPVLRRLHTLGVVLAVDDFGTGYSSLAYLRQLPVDEVKIDKSFVLGMGSDLGDLAVVRSIVELGHSLGLTVVAEGVEEDIARDQLAAMGCDVAQGYLISRPLSETRLEAWLQARTTQAQGLRDEMVLTLIT
jgi:diguanylate cyclase (GGDEF)-like protein